MAQRTHKRAILSFIFNLIIVIPKLLKQTKAKYLLVNFLTMALIFGVCIFKNIYIIAIYLQNKTVQIPLRFIKQIKIYLSAIEL